MRKASAMRMARRTPIPSASTLIAISGVVSVSPSWSSSARRCAFLARVRGEPLRLLGELRVQVVVGVGRACARARRPARIGRPLTLFVHGTVSQPRTGRAPSVKRLRFNPPRRG